MKTTHTKTLLLLLMAGCLGYASTALADTNLIHRYSFNEISGTSASDSVGGAHGTLMVTSTNGVAQGTLPTWSGTHVTCDGLGGYVDLPNGLISGLSNVTFEAWLTYNDNSTVNAWLWSFGSMTNTSTNMNTGSLEDTDGSFRNWTNNVYLGTRYTFLTPRNAGALRMRSTISDGNDANPWTEERPAVVLSDFETPTAGDTGGLDIHVAVTYSTNNGMRLFYLGTQYDSGYADNPIPLGVIEDVNCWLARSLYGADPMLACSINEFRIHEAELTSQELTASFFSGDPNVVNYDPGAATSIALNLNPNMIVDGEQDVAVNATFANIGALTIFGLDLDTLESSATNVIQIVGGRLVALAEGSSTISVSLDGQMDSAVVTVGTPELKHRYSFNESPGATSIEDSIGIANGSVVAPLVGGTALSFTNGQLNFPGGSYTNAGYADLPDNLISVLTNVTIETWFTWDGGAVWQRVFDFGNSLKGSDPRVAGNGLGYLMLTTDAGGDPGIRAEARSEVPHASVFLDGGNLTTGQEYHAALVYAPGADLSRLYLNGTLIAEGATTFALNTLTNINNWLGVSQWNDPPLDGRINELRIHEGALSPLEVALSTAAGPDALPVAPGGLVAVAVEAEDLLIGDPDGGQALLKGEFDNISDVNLTTVEGTVWEGLTTNIFTVSATGELTPVAVGSGQVRGSYFSASDTETVNVLAPISLSLQLTNLLDVYAQEQATLEADFSGYTDIDVSGFDGVTYTSSDTNVVTVRTDALLGLVSAVGPGSAEIVASYGGLSVTNPVTVTLPPGYTQPTLAHRYSFSVDSTTNAIDSIGGADGTLVDGPLSGVPVVIGGLLQLNNPGFTGPSTDANFLSLPSSILPSSGSVTIEQWFNFGGSGFFTEAWAFSDRNGGTNSPTQTNGQYFMHVISAPQGGPNPAGGGSRISQSTNGWGVEVLTFSTIEGLGAGGGGGYLDNGVAHYAATVIDAESGTLRYYVYRVSDGFGGLQNVNTAIPLSALSFNEAFIGKSPFDGDNATTGSVDEFRIWNGAMVGSDIAASFAAGPNSIITPIPGGGPELSILGALPNVILSWPTNSNGFDLEAAPLVTGPYSTNGLPAPSVVGDQYQVTVPASNQSRYFRLRD